MKLWGLRFVFALVLLILAWFASLFIGKAEIDASEIVSALLGETFADHRRFAREIVLGSRLPRSLTAVLAGGGLAISGLLMQTLFRNPLAGPSVLGISSGASLGVSLVMAGGLGAGGGLIWAGSASIAAIIGALLVLFGILAVATRLRDQVSLLIFGLMVGYFCSALVTVVEFRASGEALRNFVFWGMGSFTAAGPMEVAVLAALVLPGVALSFGLAKTLDAMLLGEEHARTLGVNYGWARLLTLLLTGVLTGVITAFCGPVAFLGLAVPHLARGIFRSAVHSVLIPATVMTGATVALICDLLCRLPGTGVGLPLNAVTSLVGAPVVLALIIRHSKRRSWF